MNSIILLGDSIFGNKPYVDRNGLPVEAYLGNMVGEQYSVFLLARDGDSISDVYRQMKKIPEGTANMFLSVEGKHEAKL